MPEIIARKPRIEFHGSFYHLISRGNQRQKVFREEKVGMLISINTRRIDEYKKYC